jgi:hypothetical protein
MENIMQPLPASRPVPSSGALYPEECDLIAALQRLVDHERPVNAFAGDTTGVDPRVQLAKIFAAFGG